MARIFDNPKEEKPHPAGEGIQKIYHFENGYGASVIQCKIRTESRVFYASYTNSDDEWELAVLVFDQSGGWSLTYDTPITDDVLGYLTEDGVEEILKKIKALPLLEGK